MTFNKIIAQKAAQKLEGFCIRRLKIGTTFETCTYTLFYKNHFYKNVEAEIDPDVKNMLRKYPT